MRFICEKNCSLIELLAISAPESSKSTLRSWIKEGRVTVDGDLAKRADLLVLKDQIVSIGPKVSYITPGMRLIYEDKHLVAIEKPVGLLSVSTAFQKEETAHALLKKYYHPRKVFVVHRLDQDTSGVMLFALSEEGYQGLKELFEQHAIERSYCAIVEGKLDECEGRWESYLYEDSQYKVHSTQNPTEGSLAVTHYFLENKTAHYSRLTLKLETGRKNQIRVHCQEHGHPVVGDEKYGAATNPLRRLCLHAQFIGFQHPVTGKQMHFSSKPPAEFDRLVKSRDGHA